MKYSDYQIGRGPEFYAQVCEMSLEGIISKRADVTYSPGSRPVDEVKCENGTRTLLERRWKRR